MPTHEPIPAELIAARPTVERMRGRGPMTDRQFRRWAREVMREQKARLSRYRGHLIACKVDDGALAQFVELDGKVRALLASEGAASKAAPNPAVEAMSRMVDVVLLAATRRHAGREFEVWTRDRSP